MNNNIHNNIECPVCPACGSRNIQTEGLLHVCLDCGNKWEDAPDGDLGEMVIYQSDEGVRLDVRLESNTVWLNQDQIVSLFNKSKSTISEHISNILSSGELDGTSVGFSDKSSGGRKPKIYNLDMSKWLFGNSEQPLNMVP